MTTLLCRHLHLYYAAIIIQQEKKERLTRGKAVTTEAAHNPRLPADVGEITLMRKITLADAAREKAAHAEKIPQIPRKASTSSFADLAYNVGGVNVGYGSMVTAYEVRGAAAGRALYRDVRRRIFFRHIPDINYDLYFVNNIYDFSYSSTPIPPLPTSLTPLVPRHYFL